MKYPVNEIFNQDSFILVEKRGKSVHIENNFATVWGKSTHLTAYFAKLQDRSAYLAVSNASHTGYSV